MNSQLSTIISREYFERVKRKSFIISTILMPVFMVALMAAPALIAIFSTPEEKRIAVVDESGVIAKTLQSGDETKFVTTRATLADLIEDEDYYGVLVIGKDIVDNPSAATLYTHAASSMQLENAIAGQIKNTVESIRLRSYNIDNLSEILAAVNADVKLQTFRVDSDETSETSSALSYMIGLVMSFMLYMFILLYGQMVMTSIIEEKNNRVLEIVVSSVKPSYLMLGKIVGIDRPARLEHLGQHYQVGLDARSEEGVADTGVEGRQQFGGLLASAGENLLQILLHGGRTLGVQPHGGRRSCGRSIRPGSPCGSSPRRAR